MLQYSKKTESFYLRVCCTPVSNMSPSTFTYEPTSYVLDHLNSFLAKQNTVSIDNRNVYQSSLRTRLSARAKTTQRKVTPMERMQHCRQALERLDVAGWKAAITKDFFTKIFW